MGDESPWQTKSQMMVALGKSARTVELYVKAGRIERMQDGSRAYFRLATPRDGVMDVTPAQPQPELLAILAEMRDEMRALRIEVAALRAVTPPQLPPGTPEQSVTHDDAPIRNEALPRKEAQRRGWIHRFLYGPT